MRATTATGRDRLLTLSAPGAAAASSGDSGGAVAEAVEPVVASAAARAARASPRTGVREAKGDAFPGPLPTELADGLAPLARCAHRAGATDGDRLAVSIRFAPAAVRIELRTSWLWVPRPPDRTRWLGEAESVEPLSVGTRTLGYVSPVTHVAAQSVDLRTALPWLQALPRKQEPCREIV